MKTLIIDFNKDTSSIGVRLISAYLKKNGHDVSILFLPFGSYDESEKFETFTWKENEGAYNQIVKFVGEMKPEFITMSLMTHFFERARELTKILKREFNIPILWGGIHPSIDPEESIKYADMVCVGEGEEPLLELANKFDKGENYLDTKSIWYKKDNKVIKNMVAPLKDDLDSHPYPDYELDTHYILDYEDDTLKKMDMDLLQKNLSYYLSDGATYRLITSRGCPFRCTYCYNSHFWNLYPNKGKYNRRRSVQHAIGELMWVKENLKFVKLIRIMDDSFIATTMDWVKDF